MKSTRADILRLERTLEQTLFKNAAMDSDVFERDLSERIDELIDSMTDDDEDAIFSLSEREGRVAMILIERGGRISVNEDARDRLRFYWKDNYQSNLTMYMPVIIDDLVADMVPLIGFTIAD